ncbi:MAG TPA: glycoside hydrolase family 2 TIM barrel-domain containing protein [bacterium]|nr:glycoside hydrolase family 2 TIM barrel-domain containing protein [bacterium]
MKVETLSGLWQLAPISAPGVKAETIETWHEMPVPSHWQQHEALREYAGRMLYRKEFPFKAKKGRRHHLVLPGIFYWSTVTLNGRRLGDHEGYFNPQRYDVTDLLAAKNELLIEVNCPNEKNRSGKRMITGVFSHWDCLDPTTNPGGIWLAPEIHSSGDAYLESCLFHTDEIGAGEASVTLRLEIVAATAGEQKCLVELTPANFEGERYSFERKLDLDAGRNKATFHETLPEPALWWTHDRGAANLYQLTVTLKSGRTVTDAVEHEVGIRTVRFDDWICTLNNERLYLKGNNQPPTDTRIATVTYGDCVRDVELYKQCNLNSIRVHAHVDHPEFYRAADRLGVLLWQDFPLQWSYSQEAMPAAVRMIREMGTLLYNHPSIGIWTCHNEPIYLVETDDYNIKEKLKSAYTLFFRSWNRDVLDVELQKALRQVDPSRFVNRSSGELDLPWRHGGDTHFYFGWYKEQGNTHRLFDSIIVKRFPNNLRFVTEFGAQSFPNLENCHKFMDADIRKIDWKELRRKHSLQPELMDYWIGLQQPDLATLVTKSQDYQSMVNRFHLDRIRRHKYAPNGGVMPFMFTDPNPAIQWSIVDYWREPKASYQAMRDAMRPVYPFCLLSADKRKQHARPIQIDVFMVNDTRDDLGEVTLDLRIADGAGREVAHFTPRASVGPDSEAVHFLTAHESPEEPGEYTVTLTYAKGKDTFANVYTFTVE